ncbi:MAG: DUF3883 domain-containing protein [Candidatus Izemoplasmatales bacterium]|nr:DUF3883 domain-containing protein [Candidatus Izemoplasmatales bacterium]
MEEKHDLYKYSNLEDIAKIKKELHINLIKSGENIDGILSNLYPDPTHFIFELLQNAEDSKAQNIVIDLDDERFIFEHDGFPFSLDDVFKICSINSSTKREDGSKIGRFGIGFKSVFGICSTPKIYSEYFQFMIRNFRIPEVIENPFGYLKNRTITVLEFNNPRKKSEDTYSLIENSFKKLDEDTLLFLNNIKCIVFKKKGEQVKSIKKRVKNRKEFDDFVSKTIIINITPEEKPNIEYLLFEMPSLVSEKKYVQIAYRSDDKALKSELRNTKLVVFFPTDQNTNLNFKLNGPFEPLEHRQSVNFNEKINQNVLNETLSLFEKSVLALRDMSLLSIDFLMQLPINEDLVYTNRYTRVEDPIFAPFFNKTKELFLKHPILKDIHNEYVSAEASLYLSGTPMLSELLTEDDLSIIYGKRTKWIKRGSLSSSKDDDEDVLASFLKNTLKIPSVKYRDFMYATNEDFWKLRNEKWLISFFDLSLKNIGTLNDNDKALLKRNQIIMTEDGSMKAPLNKDGSLAVFLGSQWYTETDLIVKKSLLSDEKAREFFTEIKIVPADALVFVQNDVINALVDAVDNDSVVNWISALELIVEVMKDNVGLKESIIHILNNHNFLPVRVSRIDAETKISKPTTCFLPVHDLKILYENNPNIYFLHDEYYEAFKDNNDLLDLIKATGINEGLKVVKLDNSWMLKDEYIQLLGEEREISRQNFSSSDYEIEEFDYILGRLTPTKSHALWNLLSKIKTEYYEAMINYRVTYDGATKVKRIESKIVRQLNEAKWLQNEHSGVLVSPLEIRYADIEESYPMIDLVSKLNFIPKIEIPKEIEQKYNLISGFSLDVISEMVERQQKIESENRFQEQGNEYLKTILINLLERDLDDEEVNTISYLDFIDFDSNGNMLYLQKIFIKNNINISQFNEKSPRKISFRNYYSYLANAELEKIKCKAINFEYKRLLKLESERNTFIEFVDKIETPIELSEDILDNPSFNAQEYIESLSYQIDSDMIDLQSEFNKNLEEIKKITLIPHEKIYEIIDNNNKIRSLLFFPINNLHQFVSDNFIQKSEALEENVDNNVSSYTEDETVAEAFPDNSWRKKGKNGGGRKPPSNEKTGYLGEKYVFEYLCNNSDKYQDVLWVSENAPLDNNALNSTAGYGYDITYRCNGEKKYIEVKSSVSKSKVIEFYMSRNEIKNAIELGDDYSLFLVRDVHDTHTISNRGNIFKDMKKILEQKSTRKTSYLIDTIKIRIK